MCTLEMLQVFSFDEKSRVQMHYAAKRQNPILRAASPVSQNLYVEYLNQFLIFFARKYASFGHSSYCQNHFGKLSHSRAKYSKSPLKILSIFTSLQHKFWLNVLIWSINFSIIETKGWYLSNDMYLKWV